MNSVQPTSGQGSSTEKSELTGHLDSIARAIFIIWTGTAMLVAMPWGWFLVGLGILILAAQLARSRMNIKIEGFPVRKSAELFTPRPGVQGRDRLHAGGSRIRTLGPPATGSSVFQIGKLFANVSRQAFALPICSSRSMISSAIAPRTTGSACDPPSCLVEFRRFGEQFGSKIEPRTPLRCSRRWSRKLYFRALSS